MFSDVAGWVWMWCQTQTHCRFAVLIEPQHSFLPTDRCCCYYGQTLITEHAYKAGAVYCWAHPALTCTIADSRSADQIFDSAAGPVWADQRLRMTCYPQRSGVLKERKRRRCKGGEHLETDRIADTEPWVNFSLPLTLSFGEKKHFHKASHLRIHFNF